MAELLEKVWQTLPAHDPERCPFCPITSDYTSPNSKVSDENDSKTLASNLNATGRPDDSAHYHLAELMTLTQGLHGQYTVQAHHLICGNEILGKQKVIQSFLCKQGRHAGKLEPCETGYDVNDANNGVWLPSTPAMYKTSIRLQTALARESPPGTHTSTELDEMAMFARFSGFTRTYAKELRMLGVNTDKTWTAMTDAEQDDVAQVAMLHHGRQFHLGEHAGVTDKAERSYVVRGIKLLDSLSVFMQHYADACPMKNDTPATSPPYVPPFYLNRHLEVLSKQMRSYVVGSPRRWKYFISKWALRLTDRLNAITS